MNAEQPHRVIPVAAALIFHDSKLLITQRPPDTHLAGLWEFPGGKKEADETWEDCLAREIREELGIEICVGRLIEVIEHSYPEKSVRLQFYACTWTGGTLALHGCAAAAWVRADELATYEFPAADEQLLDRLRRDSTLWE